PRSARFILRAPSPTPLFTLSLHDALPISPLGGTPPDEDKARELIARLDLGAAVAAGVRMLDRLKRRGGGNGKVGAVGFCWGGARSEEHTSELQSPYDLVCRLLLEKKKRMT